MSDGGSKAEGKKREERENGNEFGREVSRIAVAQICQSVGFESFNDSALEALTDITIRYLRGLGKTASFYANLAGRTECNVFDVIQGLEDLGLCRGFSGASEVSHRLTGSGTVREVIEYVGAAEEVPFAQPVPKFPVTRNRSMTPSFTQMGETPAFKHVPAWLPAFPDPHTYIHTPTWNERATDPHADKIELARQRRKAESSLLSLQQRLVCNGSAVANTSVHESDEGKALKVAKTGSNPFLVTPLQAGERDVSQVTLPANLSANAVPGNHGSVFDTSVPPLAEERDFPAVPPPAKLSADAVPGNHVSVLDTFAPAIEAMKLSADAVPGSSDSGDVDKKVIADKRPAVRLKFRIGKRILGESLDLSLQNRNNGIAAAWIVREDERDDKKRRAGLILRQSMENPLELTQL
ncbi:transcription initiation factor TFIID subunit 8 [Rhododendron vialii]|uniref:transcription initiation factor TFIID subunit 8 n=1 Tax=Rhododendron vialii TaxID=182163 RepID=UPI00265F14B5|nr:transcription initiation factor TFIID subunit 8 [Rhododendron vialii]XP_058207959.1 transcription initiation factor TFIID subunit 8 [Rhododendron vialii]